MLYSFFSSICGGENVVFNKGESMVFNNGNEFMKNYMEEKIWFLINPCLFIIKTKCYIL